MSVFRYYECDDPNVTIEQDEHVGPYQDACAWLQWRIGELGDAYLGSSIGPLHPGEAWNGDDSMPFVATIDYAVYGDAS